MLESELASIVGVTQQEIWSALFDAARDMLVNQSGALSFSHRQAREVILIFLFFFFSFFLSLSLTQRFLFQME
jgi:hypothetical protein